MIQGRKWRQAAAAQAIWRRQALKPFSVYPMVFPLFQPFRLKLGWVIDTSGNPGMHPIKSVWHIARPVTVLFIAPQKHFTGLRLRLTLCYVIFQDQLIRNSGSGTCLTSEDKKPTMASCNPSDPHQHWLFIQTPDHPMWEFPQVSQETLFWGT